MHEATIFLAIFAALLHGTAFLLYNIQTKLGESEPNAVSWGIWAFLATLNAFSYRNMSGDMVATLQFFTGSVGCSLTFLYVLAIGKLSWPKPKEWAVFILGLVAAGVWWRFRNATGANMIGIMAVVISFVPTYEGVWKYPFKETPRSWVIWTAAFLITTVNVILRGGQPIALVAPFVLCLAHGGVALLCTSQRKARFRVASSNTVDL